MEILDNARIVRALTDKGTWGVWGFIKSILQEVEISEKKIACLRNGNECNQCDKWWGCVGGLSSIEIDSFEQGFDNRWRKSIQDLVLEDLHHWLIDESGSKDELKFRLDKVKGIIGTMWSDEEISQLHVETSGIKSNGEMLLRSDGTMLGGIMPRMIEVITELNDNETEESATMKVEKVWNIVKSRLFQIECIISHMRTMLKEAEQILNPQPTPTETEPQDPIFDNWDIFEDAWVVSTFQALIKEKILSIDKGYFRWHWERSLLLWFCKQMSKYCGLANERNGKQQISWITFNDMFVCQVWGKWQVQSNKDLRSAWQDWMKAPQSDENGNPIPPKGWNVIEGIICKNYKQ